MLRLPEPPPVFDHQTRLAVARHLCQRLRARYGDEVRAVFLVGSVAKGTDLPYSDLECDVITRTRPHRWHAFFYHGLFVGLSFQPWEAYRAECATVTYEWPLTQDAPWTALPLYDPDDLLGELRRLAEAALATADWPSLLAEALADLYEQVSKVLNATLADSPDPLSALAAARQAAYWAAILVGLANRHRYQGARTMYRESLTLPRLPAGYADLLPRLLLGAADLSRLAEDVWRLWLACRALVAACGATLDDDSLARL